MHHKRNQKLPVNYVHKNVATTVQSTAVIY